MSEVYLTVGTILLVGMIAVPIRTQQLLNQLFAFMIAPVTTILEYTQRFVGGFKDRNQRILQAGGIRSEYTQRAIGSTLLFIISLIALLCDIDLVVLTLQALEIVPTTQGSFSILHLIGLNFSPAELLAIAIIASASAWGILLLDAVKRTTFTPNFLFDGDSQIFSRVISVISVFMVLLSLAILISLAFVRWDALNFDSSIETFATMGKDVLFVFIGTSILAFFTSMITFLVAVALFSVVSVGVHTLFLVPIFALHLLLSIIQQVATLAYNLCLAIINIIASLTTSLREWLQKNRAVVDDLAEQNPVPQNNAQQQQVVNPNQAVQPLAIANEFGNFTNDRALTLGDNPTILNLQDFVTGGTPPYNYNVIVQNQQVLAGNINGNILTLNPQGLGGSDASVRVTDSQNNIIEYQFFVEVIAANNQAENHENNIPVNPNAQQENENNAGFNPLNF